MKVMLEQLMFPEIKNMLDRNMFLVLKSDRVHNIRQKKPTNRATKIAMEQLELVPLMDC